MRIPAASIVIMLISNQLQGLPIVISDQFTLDVSPSLSDATADATVLSTGVCPHSSALRASHAVAVLCKMHHRPIAPPISSNH